MHIVVLVSGRQQSELVNYIHLLLFSRWVVSESLWPLQYLLEFAQIHVHRVGDAIQPSHPLLSPSVPAFNLSQRQGLS